ncbi:MAG: hypothetical protein J2P24_18500 [Streptosporangiales bacterium]|nr:hypothetical protein [Streptosporangiales bacterium]MBO0892338.1 hypothetical protein [Acidothermales bacterium]
MHIATPGRAAIVANPTRLADAAASRARIAEGCAVAGWDAPVWLETTPTDPGTGMAREAVAHGATLVCALGGDGTVRAVAAALAGTRTPLGLLPAGTGNLLARNLGVPVDSLTRALDVALTGTDRPIDVGRLVLDGDEGSAHVFLVMAGMGFDADIMASAPEHLKKRMGWPAYVVSMLQNLNGERFGVRLTFDDDPPIRRRTRAIVVGNCGRLTGGFVLLPEAEVDDGYLDAVMLAPSGVVGWAAVAARMLTKQRKGHRRVEHRRLTRLTVTADEPQHTQVDGDPIGRARTVTAGVESSALLVRVRRRS